MKIVSEQNKSELEFSKEYEKQNMRENVLANYMNGNSKKKHWVEYCFCFLAIGGLNTLNNSLIQNNQNADTCISV